MGKISVGGDWAYYDMLDGKELIDGEKITITWPDSTQEEIAITVERSSYTISDMGHPYSCPVTTAFYVFDHHGTKAKIRLKGLEAKRHG